MDIISNHFANVAIVLNRQGLEMAYVYHFVQRATSVKADLAVRFAIFGC
jgi:hypothetical protein